MAAAMRPFPARMVDEQGIEKYQEYETLGGESELTPLNAAASSLRPENQEPGADSGLAGRVSFGTGLPACVSFVISGQQLPPAGLQERSAWPVGVLACLVFLAVALVAAVVAVNPGIFKRELKSQFLLVSLGPKLAAIMQLDSLSKHVHKHIASIHQKLTLYKTTLYQLSCPRTPCKSGTHTQNMDLPAISVKQTLCCMHFQPSLACTAEAEVPHKDRTISFEWSSAPLLRIRHISQGIVWSSVTTLDACADISYSCPYTHHRLSSSPAELTLGHIPVVYVWAAVRHGRNADACIGGRLGPAGNSKSDSCCCIDGASC